MPGGKHLSESTRREIVRLHRCGKGTAEIARLTGTDRARVRRTLKAAGEKIDPSPPRVETDVHAICEHYRSSGSIKGTARALDLSPQVVKNRLQRAGEPINDASVRISTSEVVNLYRKHGASCKALARRYHCSEGTIRRRLTAAGVKIRNKAASRHIPPGTPRWRKQARSVVFKTDNGWKRLAKHNWEQVHGPVKPGCIIIRIDIERPPDTIDRIDNLAMATRATSVNRRWSARGIPWEDLRGWRHQILTANLMIAALITNDIHFKLGIEDQPTNRGSRKRERA